MGRKDVIFFLYKKTFEKYMECFAFHLKKIENGWGLVNEYYSVLVKAHCKYCEP